MLPGKTTMPPLSKAETPNQAFAGQIMSKYAFLRRDYMGKLGLVFKQNDSKDETPAVVYPIHRTMLQLKLQIQQLMQPGRNSGGKDRSVMPHVERIVRKQLTFLLGSPKPQRTATKPEPARAAAVSKPANNKDQHDTQGQQLHESNEPAKSTTGKKRGRPRKLDKAKELAAESKAADAGKPAGMENKENIGKPAEGQRPASIQHEVKQAKTGAKASWRGMLGSFAGTRPAMERMSREFDSSREMINRDRWVFGTIKSLETSLRETASRNRIHWNLMSANAHPNQQQQLNRGFPYRFTDRDQPLHRKIFRPVFKDDFTYDTTGGRSLPGPRSSSTKSTAVKGRARFSTNAVEEEHVQRGNTIKNDMKFVGDRMLKHRFDTTRANIDRVVQARLPRAENESLSKPNVISVVRALESTARLFRKARITEGTNEDKLSNRGSRNRRLRLGGTDATVERHGFRSFLGGSEGLVQRELDDARISAGLQGLGMMDRSLPILGEQEPRRTAALAMKYAVNMASAAGAGIVHRIRSQTSSAGVQQRKEMSEQIIRYLPKTVPHAVLQAMRLGQLRPHKRGIAAVLGTASRQQKELSISQAIRRRFTLLANGTVQHTQKWTKFREQQLINLALRANDLQRDPRSSILPKTGSARQEQPAQSSRVSRDRDSDHVVRTGNRAQVVTGTSSTIDPIQRLLLQAAQIDSTPRDGEPGVTGATIAKPSSTAFNSVPDTQALARGSFRFGLQGIQSTMLHLRSMMSAVRWQRSMDQGTLKSELPSGVPFDRADADPVKSNRQAEREADRRAQRQVAHPGSSRLHRANRLDRIDLIPAKRMSSVEHVVQLMTNVWKHALVHNPAGRKMVGASIGNVGTPPVKRDRIDVAARISKAAKSNAAIGAFTEHTAAMSGKGERDFSAKVLTIGGRTISLQYMNLVKLIQDKSVVMRSRNGQHDPEQVRSRANEPTTRALAQRRRMTGAGEALQNSRYKQHRELRRTTGSSIVQPATGMTLAARQRVKVSRSGNKGEPPAAERGWRQGERAKQAAGAQAARAAAPVYASAARPDAALAAAELARTALRTLKAPLAQQAPRQAVARQARAATAQAAQQHAAAAARRQAPRAAQAAAASSRGAPAVPAQRRASAPHRLAAQAPLQTLRAMRTAVQRMHAPAAAAQGSAASRGHSEGLAHAQPLQAAMPRQAADPPREAAASGWSHAAPTAISHLKPKPAQPPAPTVAAPPPAKPEIDVEQISSVLSKMPQLNINRIVDQVYTMLEKRIKFEQQRRGL